MRIHLHPPRQRTGFTLVEINLVLLLFGVGITALLGLFPVGLRQSSLAMSDTRQAMFAEMILNSIHARTLEATDYYDWSTLANFKALVASTKIAGNSATGRATERVVIGEDVTFDKYLGQNRNVIRYYLTVSEVDDYRLNGYNRPFYRVTVQVSDRRDGKFHRSARDIAQNKEVKTISPAYSIDLVYLGEVP